MSESGPKSGRGLGVDVKSGGRIIYEVNSSGRGGYALPFGSEGQTVANPRRVRSPGDHGEEVWVPSQDPPRSLCAPQRLWLPTWPLVRIVMVSRTGMSASRRYSLAQVALVWGH